MAQIPTPRSLNKTLGDMIDVFLSKFGIKKLKKGSPVLSIFEAAAMSDMRSSQQIFDLLNSMDLARASSVALDRIGLSEDLPRQQESLASGTVTVTDSRFAKISTKVYQGLPAPIVGAASINVVDASSFPGSGSVYLGRDTSNYEGPLAYTSKTPNGSFWTLNLSGHTTKFHNVGESVVLAQQGNRTIGAGAVVQTPQGNVADAVQYSTLYPAAILDGETSVSGVVVVAKKPGVIGNAPKGAINAFVSTPFAGATVSNPLPLSNGRGSESDNDYRERIKNTRASRALATPLAIKTNVLGIVSTDENKRVTSASVVRREGAPATLYIDDGTGYEERSSGVALESLNDLALGGEQYFELAQRPVTKAFARTSVSAPFGMTDGSKLAVKVGGVVYEHVFLNSAFRSVSNASAYEVVSSINADPTIQFSARTSDSGTRVIIFAKADVNEDVEVVTPATGADANSALLFPHGRIDTIRLYKNDRLLSKDGQFATLTSKLASLWNSLSGTETLTLAVDGTAAVVYSFTGQDFIDAGTGFSTMGKNTPAAWAAVINAKVPGVTATGDTTTITVTSNAGRSARAKLVISGGTLVSKGVFIAQTATGGTKEYTLNRSISQVRLETPLSAGDRLSVGSVNTRSFAESADIAPITVGAPGGSIFVAVDGAAKVIKTGITNAMTFDITKASFTGGATYRVAATGGPTPFTNATVGDWLLIWDTAAAWTQLVGLWRISNSSTTFIEFEHADLGGVTATGVSFLDTGVAIVRYPGQMQKVTAPAAANYTAESFVSALNASLLGSEALTYHTNRIRIRTNSFKDDGDVAVVAADIQGGKLLFTPADAVLNRNSHLGSVESSGREAGTPDFTDLVVASSSGASQMSVTGTIAADRMVVGLRNTASGRFGNNKSFWSPLTSVVIGAPNDIAVRKPVHVAWRQNDRVYMASPFAIGPHDDLTVVADDDAATKRFTIPLWRSLQPVGGVYGATNTFKDIGDGTQPAAFLAAAFGIDFNFNDAAVFMRARAKSHSADATKSTLWRRKEFGATGNRVRVAHTYPAVPNAAIGFAVNPMPVASPGNADVSIVLASDVKKSGYPIRNSTQLGYGYNTSPAIPAVTILSGFTVSSATRVGTTVTLTLNVAAVTGQYTLNAHGIPNGASIFLQSTDLVNFPSGVKTVVGGNGTTTITYTEAGAAVTTPNTGTVSLDTTGEATFAGATIAVGDLVRLEDVASIPANFRGQTIRITHLGTQFLQGFAERTGGVSNQTVTFAPLVDASKLVFYSVKATSCTATLIAAAINAFDGKCPVTAKVLGAGTGQVTLSTRDELAVDPAFYSLVDGINWVKLTVNPAVATNDYQLTFKNGVDAGLVTGADWANEEVRVVPITTKLLVDWLKLPALSGLFTSCSIQASSEAKKLQLATLTSGTGGSVQVQGGGGNAGFASVLGTASASGSFCLATVKAAEAAALPAGTWVSLTNGVSLPKSGIFGATSALTSIDTAGNFILSAGPVFTEFVGDAVTDLTVSVEKQGNFFAIAGLTSTTAAEGDWVRITAPTTPGSDISSVNRGIFRVVRTTANTVWIENASGLEESAVKCNARFFAADSLMPGDTVSINTANWGVANQGTWVVESVGGTPDFGSPLRFKVVVSATKATTAQGVVAALGATEGAKVIALEGQPTRLIKRVHALVPNQSDVTLIDMKFDTSKRSTTISAAAGTTIAALDKLAFPVDISRGVDGYSYSTGLIGEATRVVYGDERDPAGYPGVAAAGDRINIIGPLVKRVQVSLGIRAKLGIPTADIADQVRSAVASLINETAIGAAIALSDIVAAAGRVNGVAAVTVLSPSYGVGSDLISVQPFEKPLVLNVEQDVIVSFIAAD